MMVTYNRIMQYNQEIKQLIQAQGSPRSLNLRTVDDKKRFKPIFDATNVFANLSPDEIHGIEGELQSMLPALAGVTAVAATGVAVYNREKISKVVLEFLDGIKTRFVSSTSKLVLDSIFEYISEKLGPLVDIFGWAKEQFLNFIAILKKFVSNMYSLLESSLRFAVDIGLIVILQAALIYIHNNSENQYILYICKIVALGLNFFIGIRIGSHLCDAYDAAKVAIEVILGDFFNVAKPASAVVDLDMEPIGTNGQFQGEDSKIFPTGNDLWDLFKLGKLVSFHKILQSVLLSVYNSLKARYSTDYKLTSVIPLIEELEEAVNVHFGLDSIYNLEKLIKVKAKLTEVNNLLSRFGRDLTLPQNVVTRVNMVAEQLRAAENAITIAKPRPEPILLCIFGSAGTYKSSTMNRINAALVNMHMSLFAGKTSGFDVASFIFAHNSGVDYFDSYGNPLVYYADDPDSAVPDKPSMDFYARVVNMVSTAALPLNVDGMAKKGKVYFNAPYITLTSNRDPAAAYHNVTDQCAVRRRMTVITDLQVPKKDLNGIPMIDFDNATMSLQVFNVYTAKYETVGSNIGFAEVARFVSMLYARNFILHADIHAKVVSTKGEVIDARHESVKIVVQLRAMLHLLSKNTNYDQDIIDRIFGFIKAQDSYPDRYTNFIPLDMPIDVERQIFLYEMCVKKGNKPSSGEYVVEGFPLPYAREDYINNLLTHWSNNYQPRTDVTGWAWNVTDLYQVLCTLPTEFIHNLIKNHPGIHNEDKVIEKEIIPYFLYYMHPVVLERKQLAYTLRQSVLSARTHIVDNTHIYAIASCGLLLTVLYRKEVINVANAAIEFVVSQFRAREPDIDPDTLTDPILQSGKVKEGKKANTTIAELKAKAQMNNSTAEIGTNGVLQSMPVKVGTSFNHTIVKSAPLPPPYAELLTEHDDAPERNLVRNVVGAMHFFYDIDTTGGKENLLYTSSWVSYLSPTVAVVNKHLIYTVFKAFCVHNSVSEDEICDGIWDIFLRNCYVQLYPPIRYHNKPHLPVISPQTFSFVDFFANRCGAAMAETCDAGIRDLFNGGDLLWFHHPFSFIRDIGNCFVTIEEWVKDPAFNGEPESWKDLKISLPRFMASDGLDNDTNVAPEAAIPMMVKGNLNFKGFIVGQYNNPQLNTRVILADYSHKYTERVTTWATTPEKEMKVRGIISGVDTKHGDCALPWIIVHKGRPKILGIHVVKFESQGHSVAGLAAIVPEAISAFSQWVEMQSCVSAQAQSAHHSEITLGEEAYDVVPTSSVMKRIPYLTNLIYTPTAALEKSFKVKTKLESYGFKVLGVAPTEWHVPTPQKTSFKFVLRSMKHPDRDIRSRPGQFLLAKDLLGIEDSEWKYPGSLHSDQYLITVKKYAPKPDVPCNFMAARKACEVLKAHLKTRIKSLRIYTYDEAVAGIPGTSFGSIARNKSAGWPYKGLYYNFSGKKVKLDKKSDVFGVDETFDLGIDDKSSPAAIHCRTDVHMILRMAKRGVSFPLVNSDSLKDEPVKCVPIYDTSSTFCWKQKDTRIFACASLPGYIRDRMYLGDFVRQCTDFGIHLGFAMGLDTVKDAPHLYEKLHHAFDPTPETQYRFGASDFSAFDASHRKVYTGMIFDDVIIPMYRELILDANQWKSTHNVLQIIKKDLQESLHLYGGVIYAWEGPLPSGNFMTAMMNSLYNHFAHLYCFYAEMWHPRTSYTISDPHIDFYDHVYMSVMGDDIIFGYAPDTVLFNHRVTGEAITLGSIFNEAGLTPRMAELNLVYTSDDKSAGARVLNRSIYDITFLKTHFVRADDRVQMRLDRLSILKPFIWDGHPLTKKDGEVIIRQQWQEKLNQAARELCLYGKEEYLETMYKLQESVQLYTAEIVGHILPFDILDYKEALYTRYFHSRIFGNE